MAFNIPQNWWQRNQFMMPQIQMPQRQPAGILAPQTDQSGILSTSNFGMPDYAGSGGGKGGTVGGGMPDLNRGPAEYGFQAGNSATADTTTTGSTDWRGVLGLALANAIPGIGSLATVTGLTEQAKQALGLQPTPQYAALAASQPSADYNDPGHPDNVGAPTGGDLGPGNAGAGLGANGAGSGDGESPGLYAKGGPVMAQALMGGDPPGPDTGYGGLMGGEFVVNAKAAKKHRGLLDGINAGASKAKLRGILG